MSALDDYVHQTEKRLKHWGGELDKLAQNALSADPAQAEKLEHRRVELQKKLDFAHSRLEALRGAGEHRWEAFKEELELSLRELQKSFKSEL